MISICPLPLLCRYTVDLPLPLVYRFTFTPLRHSFSLSYNALYCSNSGLPLLCCSLLFFPFCLFILFKVALSSLPLRHGVSVIHSLTLELDAATHSGTAPQRSTLRREPATHSQTQLAAATPCHCFSATLRRRERSPSIFPHRVIVTESERLLLSFGVVIERIWPIFSRLNYTRNKQNSHLGETQKNCNDAVVVGLMACTLDAAELLFWRNSPSKLTLRFYLKIWLSSSLSICHICTCNMLILLCILHIILNGPTLCLGNKVEDKILKVGEELWRETLPLQGGSCFYQLQGLKPHTWYEVKISYPASIPASFSIQLKRNKSDVVLNNNRRLLNTEKLIFKTNSNQDEFLLVLVTVEPEGFPAKLHVAERQFIIFNIVCDELLLGIPHKAWWVVALALLCLGIAFIVPSFLPLHLLPKNQVLRTDDYVSKIS
ncbi:hypothetical protein HKD37_19G054934 [Glycine soja]